ncbi:diguanylate cyclase domain-containing protein [Lysinibacillus piscis]|uniref:Membrane protein YdaK n=1 Tax=Lysinibacillus piscis TaxID=2518931 RepID=A0ABQ5NJX7_9BACI|nr:diguanylate cyclase [Lysinibacillus sp. KH24]GLC88607.1 putative membrane protein YdaK [Lysinibacillus sp. KH24]
MRKAMNWNKSILIYGIVLLLLLQCASYFLLHQDTDSLLLHLFLILLILLTLWRGTVFGLISSLLFIFVSGSMLLYISFVGSIAYFNVTLPMNVFFIYGVALLLNILCAGKVHELLVEQARYIHLLQQDIQNYVAIDVETGFENEARMRISVNEEMRRADRHKHTFVFIALKIENYEQFQTLYGIKEAHFLWQQLAQRIQETVRQTDKKYRFRDNYVGLLLIDTTEEYIGIIYDKLDQALRNHQLLNEKWVTLNYKTSYFTYQPLMNETFDELLVELEREMKTSEL